MTMLDDDMRLGRQVVAEGKLEPLRKKLGLTRSAMAELLYTTGITYKTWEVNTKTLLWPETAGRIGRFYRNATQTLELWGEDVKGYVPLYSAATMMGMPLETLMGWYRDGHFEATDLGILGLWVKKTTLKSLRSDRAAVRRLV